MTKTKLTGKDIGSFARDDQRYIKNTDPDRYVEKYLGYDKIIW